MKKVHNSLPTWSSVLMMFSIFIMSSCGPDGKKENSNKKQKREGKSVTEKTEKKINKVVKTDSGLKYEILSPGNSDGTKAEKNSQVLVHYTGWLENNGKKGDKFDSSLDRNAPFSFKIGAGYVIAGWDEGVKGMLVGEKRRLTIPSHLAYGERGAGKSIPANSTLIFDIELLKVS